MIADRYLYFIPYYDGFEYNGVVLRYNTQADFFSPSSWEAYDANNTNDLPTVGFVSGTAGERGLVS